MISVFSFFTILNSALLSGFVAQIYRFSPFFRVSKRKLYFLTPTFYLLLHRFYSLTRVASCFASGRVRNRIPVPYIYYRYKEKTNLLVTPSTLKKSFCFFYPHTSLFRMGSILFCQGFYVWVNGQGASASMLHCWCIYAVYFNRGLRVQCYR